MRKTHKISQEQEEGLRRLIIWLSSYHHDTAVFVNNKFREITYFSDIISKVVVLGEYTDDEKQTLNELWKMYNNKEPINQWGKYPHIMLHNETVNKWPPKILGHLNEVKEVEDFDEDCGWEYSYELI